MTPTLQPRQGGALLVILPCILLLELIVAGALAIASVQAADGGIRARRLAARLAAESAARHAMQRLHDMRADTLTTGTGLTIALPADEPTTTPASATLLTVGRGRIAVVAESRVDDRPALRTATIVEILTADTLWSLFRAALHTDGDVEITGSISADASHAECPPQALRAAERAAAVIGPGIILPAGRTVSPPDLARISGSPPVEHATDAALRRTAALSILRALAALADHSLPGGTLTPRPSALAGQCVFLDPVNWGDPAGLTTCAEHHPLVYIDGDLHIDGGVGQALLVVDGDVHIDNTARFDGAILATGNASIGNAAINGAVRSLGDGTSTIEGSIDRDLCALWHALSSPAARRPFRRSDRLWLPME